MMISILVKKKEKDSTIYFCYSLINKFIITYYYYYLLYYHCV